MSACGKYLGDNDGTCPQLTCVRVRGHAGPCDNVRGDEADALYEALSACLAHVRHSLGCATAWDTGDACDCGASAAAAQGRDALRKAVGE